MDDIFEQTLNLEQKHFDQGFADGHKDGLVAGKEEARQVGLKVGFEVGEELGFYKGCADVWSSAIRADPTQFSARVQKGVKQIEELVGRYPVMEPQDERVQEIMEELRSKFKVVCGSLGVKLEYKGYPKGSSSGDKDVSF